METMKLNVKRCTVSVLGMADGISEGHPWSSEPTIEMTECGPVAWWVCGRCPARVLHDPETEDGFPEEPIVVYPPSCFDFDGDAEEITLSDGSAMTCGCPRKASGDVVHLRGCVEEAQIQIEEHLRELDEEASFTGPLSLAEHPCPPEPASVVHPPTDPAPPSEELARAMADLDADEANDRAVVIQQIMEDTGCTAEQAERDLDEHLRLEAIEEADEEPPTLKRPTPVPVESGASFFERVETLFGRPFKLGEDAGMDMAFDALGRIEG